MSLAYTCVFLVWSICFVLSISTSLWTVGTSCSNRFLDIIFFMLFVYKKLWDQLSHPWGNFIKPISIIFPKKPFLVCRYPEFSLWFSCQLVLDIFLFREKICSFNNYLNYFISVEIFCKNHTALYEKLVFQSLNIKILQFLHIHGIPLQFPTSVKFIIFIRFFLIKSKRRYCQFNGLRNNLKRKKC